MQTAKRSTHNLNDLRDLARLGAQQRLAALDAERRQLEAMFPDLRAPGAQVRLASVMGDGATPPRRRRRMSAAARKAVGEPMRAYWATRRAEKQAASERAAGGRKGRKK